MRYLWLILVLTIWQIELPAQVYRIDSPDGKIRLEVQSDSLIKWKLLYNDISVIESGMAGLTTDKTGAVTAGTGMPHAETGRMVETIENPVPTKFRKFHAVYNRLILRFEGGFDVEFRVSDEGFAYRFLTDHAQPLIVESEQVLLSFPRDCRIFFPREEKLQSHYERLYQDTTLMAIENGSFASLPLLVKTREEVSLLITDADLYDYPNLFLQKTEGNRLKGLFPRAVLEARPAERGSDRNEVIVSEAAYIALTDGRRTFPWRVFALAGTDKELLENQMVFNLSRPPAGDFSWVKPGKVAWDWWNDNNIHGVDFVSGINTATYQYYIDFAAAFGLAYIILDEGWSATTTDLLHSAPNMDIPGLMAYAKSRNVGIILWVLWKPFYHNMEEVITQFERWGAAGIKVDFMQRADQQMVNIYRDIAERAAASGMLVDFHGSFKPSGLRRAFPNVLSYEGVKGLENAKWSRQITPAHNLTLPFIRMVAGPMDYTPGAMVNKQKENFSISWNQPMSMGTRAHQAALYTIYESPLQMLCDNPGNYLKDSIFTRFIADIPVVWDSTIALEGRIGEFLVMARKNGENWYLAALTDWTEREIDVSLSFLGPGKYQAVMLADGINANRHAEDYRISRKIAVATDRLTIRLAKGGGFSAVLKPVND
jgi:alpha-glucosidase